MKYFILIFCVLTINTVALADTVSCSTDNLKNVSYSDEKRGEVVLYISSSANQFDLNCLLAKEFLKRVYKFPDTFTYGIVTEDFKEAKLVQWKVKDNYFLNIEVFDGVGRFIKYKYPLSILKMIFTGDPFPTKSSKFDSTVQASSVSATPELLKKLIKFDSNSNM